MRKIFALLLFLVILTLITPLFIGRYVNDLLPTYYSAMTRFATVKIVQTEKHWFSEDLTLQLSPVVHSGQTFTLQQHIIFGPFIFADFNKVAGPHLGLALLNTVAVNAPFTLSSQALIKFNRSVSGFDQISNLNYQNGLNSINIPSVSLHFLYDLSHSLAQAELTMPAVTVNMQDAAHLLNLTANLANLTSTARLKISQGIWYGNEGLTVDSINLKNDNQQVVVNALSVNDTLDKLGSTANFNLALNAKSLTSDSLSYQPLAFNFELRGLDVATLENFARSLHQLSLPVDETQINNLNQQFYLVLLQHGLSAEVKNAQLGTPHGVLTLDLNFVTPAQNYADIQTALNESNNTITLSLPKPMAQALLEKYFAQSPLAASLSQPALGGEQTADLLLQQFVNLKFLKLSPDNQSYIVEISMKNGRIYVNNQSLQDTLDLLAPASSSKKPSNKSKLAITTQEMVEHYDS